MEYFKFVNWWIGEFMVSFFDVTNRLLVLVRLDSRLLDFIFIKYLTIMAQTALKNLILKCDAPFFCKTIDKRNLQSYHAVVFEVHMYKKWPISPHDFFKKRSFCIKINICFHEKYIWFWMSLLFCRVPNNHFNFLKYILSS